MENVVDLVKEHPEGIPLKKLEIFYDLSYKQNFSLSDLGFKNISCLVESLKEDLVVKQKRVFHKKAKEASQKEAGAPVFRERFHAQQREVHGGNMRAVEAMEMDEGERAKGRNRAMDPEWINSMTESVIREIASEGELVTKEKVISRVCQMNPSLDPRKLHPKAVPALHNLLYLTREINMFIEEAVTSICTLYELGQSLAGMKDKKRFEELNMGPLCKLPLVHRMFKIDSDTRDDDIYEIETVDILKRLDLAEFLQHLADHYNCESPYELGIRINGFGLPISERAREVIQRELEEETMDRLKKVKKSILEPMQGAGSFSSVGNSDLRKKYASMPAADVVLEVLSNATEVFSGRMSKDRLARALFQLAICGGSLAAPLDLVPKDKTPKTAAEAKTVDNTAAATLPKVKQYLKESLAAQKSAISLGHIAALEKKLTEHFHIKDFLSLKQGTFLNFLVKHIQLLQEALGSALFLGTSVEVTGSGFRPSRQDVFEFIKQCLAHIESALRSHYRVRDSRDLGYGTLQHLSDLVRRQRELAGGGGLSPIYYIESGYESVGRLGQMSKAQALASLLSCPLLEDLNTWSQWELIFKPSYGPLKDFIERNAANTGLAVLEVSPGLLLRITTDTGDKHFSKAVAALDPVGTAGHLVSMVVADGIDNAPTALLANHMQNSLAAAVAKEYSRVANFLLQCLTKIPMRTCQALLQQVFLEPFSRVLGQAKSKEVLITVAQSDPKHLNCLHQLGILLGITDWVKDYHRKKSEFGIGVELNAEGQKLMQVHQERLGRSLDRLSTELYSKDTHFVLELIQQNADDNSYPCEGGVVPALAFVVERDCITVLNNESGFQEKNIRAICDVGRSTKGKHKYGYIQKGIGFKSVFKVTDCPEIHSNGFHLRFDKNCGPMGYILPHWSEEERPLDAWTTKICLPLRSESHQTRNLFHDVHPSLLLFLHRLRSITICNQLQSEKRLVTMTRKDLSHNVLEVEHTEGTERWLVVKTTLQPKKIKEDVESTELALAFQLGANEADSDIVCQPQKQPVFAYLPLRSFGFRFIIQDFDIPSSREDVDRDSSWNQWLRSEIPQLFLKAMEVFTQAHPEYSGLKGLCQFLHFIPLPDEVLDFFKPVAGQIIQLLKGRAFLGEVVYKLPSQVAVCQDAVIRDVIGSDELERHLSLSYLHPGLSPPPPASLLTNMGVRYLRGADVTTVTTAMAKELEGGLRQLARLLVCNFRAIEHGYGEAESILQNLRELTIIPLADGRVVALSAESVFFPPELYKDLSMVPPTLLNCLDPLESQQVRELLKRLGVHEMEPQELLEQHIYKPQSVVVSYLVFIKQHSSSSQEYADIAVPVLTCRGLLCPATERVHFSEEYGNINLPKALPCDWILLSPCYVESDGDVAGWRELFSTLGVRDGLIIRKERRKLTSAELQASSPWSAESATWRQSPGKDFVLDDYPCEEFQALATAQLPDPVLLQQRMTLLQLLETNWDTMRETVSVDVLIEFLKKWCIKPKEDNQEGSSAEEETEGAQFTTTVEHIHNVYTYLDDKCNQRDLKELFQHTPADDCVCSGRFYHLKEVCWSDNTEMFKRYKLLTQREDNPNLQPKVLAPFYSQLEGMRDLKVEDSPSMKQYVGLLELICSSAAIPTAEVLQDVSALYAKLMVSDKRVFPTKDSWVSLRHKPMINDDKELEKIFKHRNEVCLLHLPPPEKKFKEEDRLSFLEICGVRQLSDCVKSQSQTESWRPCPPMQSLVRSVIPYIQRFLYHREELAEVYSELKQVGKLYIRYQLDIAEGDDPVIELKDVICLLTDEKEFYIQMDHINEKLEILACWPPRAPMLNASSSHADLVAIGDWGEQLVNSFLCQWRDSDDPGRPTHVLWCNQSGESGQPYDFKLTFGEAGATFVEVKSTMKREKSFIHMSANELDFALKEKERYHVYRVYSAGDAQSVRLCRIQNLAQHLHTKDLSLFLFV
uniref:Wu:fj29h11 n=1 Tax=Cyprinodon variegatus TaxID=28743 RepID=A0A3Q2G8V1_CYPVA